jgi:hypothetical protein
MTEYLNKMTVKDLREIAGRMGIYLNRKHRKATIVFLIEIRIESNHVEALEMNKSLHVDVPTVIDTVEFPMDHQQFTDWYNKHGGLESFDGFQAVEDDHEEALQINAQTPIETLIKAESTIKAMAPEYAEEIHKAEQIETFTIPNTDIVITDPASVIVLKAHFKAVKRFNPTLKRDKGGKVILTAKQRRRIHKTDRKVAKKMGLYTNA